MPATPLSTINAWFAGSVPEIPAQTPPSLESFVRFFGIPRNPND
jgi:hypothetical protein